MVLGFKVRVRVRIRTGYHVLLISAFTLLSNVVVSGLGLESCV